MQYVFWVGFALWSILVFESVSVGLPDGDTSDDVARMMIEALKVRVLRGIVYALMAFTCLYTAMNWGK